MSYQEICAQFPTLLLSTLLAAETAFLEADVDGSGEIDATGTINIVRRQTIHKMQSWRRSY